MLSIFIFTVAMILQVTITTPIIPAPDHLASAGPDVLPKSSHHLIKRNFNEEGSSSNDCLICLEPMLDNLQDQNQYKQELKQVNQELKQVNQELKQVSQELNQFNQDIKTPVKKMKTTAHNIDITDNRIKSGFHIVTGVVKEPHVSHP
ncbi:hypothetical protein PGT21_026544 [Puccinia graminis f. sp. tritici]|uniref:Uncharacterized protein n=1 Tax=Puccinia graminis f. sp. tritici TaxID=56615 RepID=A0A5B0Q6W0_PUCGR|nr:hypothetical protein PGT21_026544 [Puccinia graminis f. sp. tritici]